MEVIILLIVKNTLFDTNTKYLADYANIIPESEGITLVVTEGKPVVMNGTVAANINHEQSII